MQRSRVNKYLSTVFMHPVHMVTFIAEPYIQIDTICVKQFASLVYLLYKASSG